MFKEPAGLDRDVTADLRSRRIHCDVRERALQERDTVGGERTTRKVTVHRLARGGVLAQPLRARGSGIDRVAADALTVRAHLAVAALRVQRALAGGRVVHALIVVHRVLTRGTRRVDALAVGALLGVAARAVERAVADRREVHALVVRRALVNFTIELFAGAVGAHLVELAAVVVRAADVGRGVLVDALRVGADLVVVVAVAVETALDGVGIDARCVGADLIASAIDVVLAFSGAVHDDVCARRLGRLAADRVEGDGHEGRDEKELADVVHVCLLLGLLTSLLRGGWLASYEAGKPGSSAGEKFVRIRIWL